MVRFMTCKESPQVKVVIRSLCSILRITLTILYTANQNDLYVTSLDVEYALECMHTQQEDSSR